MARVPRSFRSRLLRLRWAERDELLLSDFGGLGDGAAVEELFAGEDGDAGGGVDLDVEVAEDDVHLAGEAEGVAVGDGEGPFDLALLVVLGVGEDGGLLGAGGAVAAGGGEEG